MSDNGIRRKAHTARWLVRGADACEKRKENASARIAVYVCVSPFVCYFFFARNQANNKQK